MLTKREFTHDLGKYGVDGAYSRWKKWEGGVLLSHIEGENIRVGVAWYPTNSAAYRAYVEIEGCETTYGVQDWLNMQPKETPEEVVGRMLTIISEEEMLSVLENGDRAPCNSRIQTQHFAWRWERRIGARLCYMY